MKSKQTNKDNEDENRFFFRTYSVLKLIKSTNIPPGREAMLFPDKVL